jgi:hypothetical protein
MAFVISAGTAPAGTAHCLVQMSGDLDRANMGLWPWGGGALGKSHATCPQRMSSWGPHLRPASPRKQGPLWAGYYEFKPLLLFLPGLIGASAQDGVYIYVVML